MRIFIIAILSAIMASQVIAQPSATFETSAQFWHWYASNMSSQQRDLLNEWLGNGGNGPDWLLDFGCDVLAMPENADDEQWMQERADLVEDFFNIGVTK